MVAASSRVLCNIIRQVQSMGNFLRVSFLICCFSAPFAWAETNASAPGPLRLTILSWCVSPCEPSKVESYRFAIVEGSGILASESSIKALGQTLDKLPRKLRELGRSEIWWNSGWNEDRPLPKGFVVPKGLPLYEQILKDARASGSEIHLPPGDE